MKTAVATKSEELTTKKGRAHKRDYFMAVSSRGGIIFDKKSKQPVITERKKVVRDFANKKNGKVVKVTLAWPNN